MPVRLCTYNLEWFDDAFETNNLLKTDPASIKKATAIAAVLKAVDPDMVSVIEGPGTTASTGKSTIACLEGFAARFGLRLSKAAMGFASRGRQEIALMYDPARLSVSHMPGGSATSHHNPAFDHEFQYDSDADGIEELYSHYRPPMEMKLDLAGGGEFWLITAHTKSKGIFSHNDMLHYQREEERNRRKLFAETSHIRLRVEEWLALGRKVIVTGDINDGPGMDNAEFRFGRSAVENIMGDVFAPDAILRSWAGRPVWRAHGFEPSSARFVDRFTSDPVNVLIDHILVSSDVPVAGPESHVIWNPYQTESAKPLKSDLLAASDHFPVSLDIA